jgi:hypothetical protein
MKYLLIPAILFISLIIFVNILTEQHATQKALIKEVSKLNQDNQQKINKANQSAKDASRYGLKTEEPCKTDQICTKILKFENIDKGDYILP